MKPTDQQIIDAMEQKGGHFVRALAECFKRADFRNTMRLNRAFPDIIRTYRKIAAQELETAAREMEVPK